MAASELRNYSFLAIQVRGIARIGWPRASEPARAFRFPSWVRFRSQNRLKKPKSLVKVCILAPRAPRRSFKKAKILGKSVYFAPQSPQEAPGRPAGGPREARRGPAEAARGPPEAPKRPGMEISQTDLEAKSFKKARILGKSVYFGPPEPKSVYFGLQSF